MARPVLKLVEVAEGEDGKGGEVEGSDEEWAFLSRIAVAGLDMLVVVQSRVDMKKEEDVAENWMGVILGLEVVAKYASMTAVRQHAITILFEAVTDVSAKLLSKEVLRGVVWGCCSVGEERLENIFGLDIAEDLIACADDVVAEVNLSILLAFKGFLCHLEELLREGGDKMEDTWTKLLNIAGIVLEGGRGEEFEKFHSGGIEMCVEQLRNTLNVMLKMGAFAEGGELRKVTVDRVGELKGVTDVFEESAGGHETSES